MRSIVVIIFAIMLANAWASSEEEEEEEDNLRADFESLYGAIMDSKANEPIWVKLKTIDGECVRKRIKLSENGNKTLGNEFILRGLLVPSFGFCSGNLNEFAGLVVDAMAKKTASGKGYEGKEDCFKRALKEIEPDAILLKGFDSNSLTLSDDECEEAVEKRKFDRMIVKLEAQILKRDLEEYTCGVILKSELFKTLVKFPIIGFKRIDAEVAKEAKQELVELLVGKAEKFEECLNKLISDS